MLPEAREVDPAVMRILFSITQSGIRNQRADVLSSKPGSMVAISNELDNTAIAAAKETPSLTNKWRKFRLKIYYQIWFQLTLHGSVLYRKVKTPTMQEESYS